MTIYRLLSDLHMEGNKFQYTDVGEDVLLLAGDIHTRNRLHEFLDQIPPSVQVLFVAGNHEYYHSVFEESNRYFKLLETKYNFKFLNNEWVTIDDVPIFGGTMFTDYELYGVGEAWFAEHRSKDGINDFEVMLTLGEHYEPRRWRVSDHKAQHQKFLEQFKLFMKHTEGAEKRIVMSHFMPTDLCTPERFKNNTMNPYFTTNMEPYMGFGGYWVHGHGHNNVDVMVGDTRVLANPKGYVQRGVYENSHFDPNLVFEL